MATRQCCFWKCSTTVEAGHSWCGQHYRAYRRGLLDECPGCGRGKERRYSTCLDCRAVPSALPVPEEHTGLFLDQEYYVFVLQLEDGRFFVESSRSPRLRLMEHRDGLVAETAGYYLQLVWFTALRSRNEAEALLASVRRLCWENPREMRRWILRFTDMVRELRTH